MAESPGTNAVSISLPVDGYVNVARLVTAGFGSQLEFGFEAIDDLQLAIELALRSVPARDGYATVALARDETGLTVTVSGSEGEPLDQRFPDAGEGLDLLSCLGRLVDSVDVVAGAAPAVVLRKKRRSAEVVPGA
ncbi:MAG: hypothetical protein ACM3QU_01965 [Verrucomicrobiota bacterium]